MKKEGIKVMSRGIVTIATGSDRYYSMAKNLLHSIRVVSPDTNVAIITDNKNPYKQEYDDVIILSTPHNSYLDKIDLLINCPYDENIFLDADSLMYKNIDYLWSEFLSGSDFSYLGERLPLNSKDGFFEYENVKDKLDFPVHYIPRLHGGLYYIRSGEYCKTMWNLCMKIKANYKSYNFKIFTEPADEPIISLAAAIMDSTVVERINDICFLPVTDKVYANFLKEKLDYINEGIDNSAAILHFSNHNTEKAFYKNEVDKINSCLRKKCFFMSKWIIYFMNDHFGTKEKAKCTFYAMLPQWVQKSYHFIKDKI